CCCSPFSASASRYWSAGARRASCRGIAATRRPADFLFPDPIRRRKSRRMTDALVKSALHHWAARLVANGVTLTDFEEVTDSLGSWNDWCAGWSARAAVHETLGRDALAQGKTLSAGDHLQRAGVYYHFAKFLFVHDLAQM